MRSFAALRCHPGLGKMIAAKGALSRTSTPLILLLYLGRLDGLYNQFGASIRAQSTVYAEVVKSAIRRIAAIVVPHIVDAPGIHAVQQSLQVVFVRVAKVHALDLFRERRIYQHAEHLRIAV
jgi:hypothetical protein